MPEDRASEVGKSPYRRSHGAPQAAHGVQGLNGGMPSIDHVLGQAATQPAHHSQAVAFLYCGKQGQQKTAGFSGGSKEVCSQNNELSIRTSQVSKTCQWEELHRCPGRW